jgi:ectoine hydroxylase-related dioxygenase (phytanoyl-CoA dioxygenase family)
VLEPTAAQIETYRRDGFLVLEAFLDRSELDRIRERFARSFEHEWETGLQPDEVNYTPGVTAPDLTRQLCNVWKADRTLAGVVLSRQVGRFSARLALDDTAADTGTIYYVRGSHRWPHAIQGGSFHAPDDWLAHVRRAVPPSAELELVPIQVPAGGAAFHDGWTFHGSPANERADAERRSIISHLISTDTRWNPAHPHPVYSRYRRPAEREIDEAFFPVLWRDGYRTPWLDGYLLAAPVRAGV